MILLQGDRKGRSYHDTVEFKLEREVILLQGDRKGRPYLDTVEFKA